MECQPSPKLAEFLHRRQDDLLSINPSVFSPRSPLGPIGAVSTFFLTNSGTYGILTMLKTALSLLKGENST
jgi:hypothetical protein